MNEGIGKIAIIGNGGGGKSTLARKLAQHYNLPLMHVDSIQYLAGMKTRNQSETRTQLNEIASLEKWIIDGFGPMDVMQDRFKKADKIIFIDFPLWRHYWWCTKRQIESLKKPRAELPANCNEATIAYTITLFKILWRVHKKIRPELLDFFTNSDIAEKVVTVRSIKDWQAIYLNGIIAK